MSQVKLPTKASSFKNVHLNSMRVSIKPAPAEDHVIPNDVKGTNYFTILLINLIAYNLNIVLDANLEKYVVSYINSDVLSNPKFDVLKFGCILNPEVQTLIIKLHEVMMNSSKKLGKNKTLTDILINNLLCIAKLNAFPLMIR